MRDTTSNEHPGALQIMRIDDVEGDLRSEDRVARTPQEDPTDVIDVPARPIHFRTSPRRGGPATSRQTAGSSAPRQRADATWPGSRCSCSWGSCPAPTARTPDQFARRPHAIPSQIARPQQRARIAPFRVRGVSLAGADTGLPPMAPCGHHQQRRQDRRHDGDRTSASAENPASANDHLFDTDTENLPKRRYLPPHVALQPTTRGAVHLRRRRSTDAAVPAAVPHHGTRQPRPQTGAVNGVLRRTARNGSRRATRAGG